MSRTRIAVVASIVGVAAAATAGLWAVRSPSDAEAAVKPAKKISIAQLALHDAMRKLWEDHVTWTRLYIVDVVEDSPEAEATAGRLLQNQVDIGDAIKPYYGDAAGSQLTALLQEHILIAADLLAAANAGDEQGVKEATDRWYANANDIAAFLASANPESWPLVHMQHMMKEHLDGTLAEAVANLSRDFEADLAAYDAVHLQILEMADMLTDGIVAQFPKDF
jgi:hypothetical protein